MAHLNKIKVFVRYIFAGLFLSLKESTYKTKKNVSVSLQKLFSFSRKSNFMTSQMTKHKKDIHVTE